jgi:hypothetical protein
MTCGVDWWAVAAGRGPIRQKSAAGDGDQKASTRTAGAWWSAVPVGQRLRIGVGLAGIVLMALYALVDTSSGTSDQQANEVAPVQGIARPAQLSSAPELSSELPVASDLLEPTTADGPATENTPPPAIPTPAPLPTTVVLEGSGSKVTEPFAYPGGRVRVYSLANTSSPTGCQYIGTFRSTDPAALSIDPSLLTALILLENAGSTDGWVDLELPPASYFMEIESDCDWVVTVAPS